MLIFKCLLEKEMAAHPSILAWKIPWTEERGWRGSKGFRDLVTAPPPPFILISVALLK